MLEIEFLAKTEVIENSEVK